MGVVLVYHLWPSRLPGGFVGVDVFFVISGFLIGGHLLAELDDTGRVRLGRFWARRAARLLPASLLTLLVVAVATLTVVPLSRRSGIVDELVGSTFYVQNWVLADKSVDYLAAGEAPSPVQHYWSLSAEEQFYVLLPLLLVAIAALSRITRLPRRAAALGAVSTVAVASLAWSVHQTASNPAVAYFSTLTRAWEFLGGVLLAFVVVVPSRRVRTTLGWVGLAAVVASLVLIDGATPFPGTAALLPVLGALALVAARDAGPLALAARWRPVTWLGDHSYALYLWHWPVIVLVPDVTGHPLTALEKAAVGVVSLLLAWGSTRFEHVVRSSPRLLGGRRPRQVGVLVLAASLVVAGAALGTGRLADRELDRRQAAAERLVADAEPGCLGAATLVGEPPSGCPDLDGALVPAPAAAGLDDHNDAACFVSQGPDFRLCRLDGGRPDAKRVLAVGDSHNTVYLPVWEQLARERGWQVDVAARAACAWVSRDTVDPQDPVRGRDCSSWKARLAEHLAEAEPYDLILTTESQTGPAVTRFEGESRRDAAIAAHAEVWGQQVGRGSVVVALRDTPLARPDVVECVERETTASVGACSMDRAQALRGLEALKATSKVTPGTALVDVTDAVCPRGAPCPPVIGNVVVYRDRTHLTATFVRTLAPVLVERIDAAEQEARRSVTAP